MFSWVAYLEDQSEEDRLKYIASAMKGIALQSEEDRLKYIASAMKGIALVDEEMTRRGIGTCS